MPGVGRFSNPDPGRDQHFELTQSWNIYSYVRNSPILNTDPTGMNLDGKEGERDPSNPEVQATGSPTATSGITTSMDSKGVQSTHVVSDVGKKMQAQVEEEPAGLKLLKAWAAETDSVAASLVVSTWDKKGSMFGLVGENHGVGHVAIADSASGTMLLSQFPADGKPGDANVTKTAKETRAEEKRAPDHSYSVEVKNRGAFARQALAETGKKKWTPMGIFGTQCAVSSTKSLFAGGSGAVDKTPFRWPGSLTRRLDGLAGVPGVGVTRADPKLVASIYGD